MPTTSAAVADRFFAWIVPATFAADLEVFRRAKRVAALDICFLIWSLVFAALYCGIGLPRCGLVTAAYAIWACSSLFFLQRGRSVAFCANLLCLGGCVTLIVLAVYGGGAMAPPLLWLSCAPMVAVITAGAGWGLMWLLFATATVALFVLAERLGVTFLNETSPTQFHLLYFCMLTGLFAAQFLVVWLRVGIEQRALDALQETENKLATARETLATLERGFGFSQAEWEKLKRENVALKYALGHQCQSVDDGDLDELPDDLADELADLDELDEFALWPRSLKRGRR